MTLNPKHLVSAEGKPDLGYGVTRTWKARALWQMAEWGRDNGWMVFSNINDFMIIQNMGAVAGSSSKEQPALPHCSTNLGKCV